MSNTSQKRPAPAPSDPLAASRVNAQPVAPPAPAVPEEPEAELVPEPVPPPIEVPRAPVRRYRVAERVKVSNGGTTVVLPRGKTISTSSHGEAFIARALRAGAKLEELPSE